MAVNIYQELSTPAEKLAAMRALFTELQREWADDDNQSTRYEVSSKASRVFWPGGFAYRISAWFNADGGEELRAAVADLHLAQRWFADWMFQNASLVEKMETNRTEDEWRISKR
jgi:hypothetical protein